MNHQVQIHKTGQKEMRVVIDLLKDFYDTSEVKAIKHLESRIRSDRHLLLLAKISGKPVGLIECSIEEIQNLYGNLKRGLIEILYVKEEYRKKGVAGQLVEASGYWFASSDVDQVAIIVPEDNSELKGFIENKNFQVTSKVWTKSNIGM